MSEERKLQVWHEGWTALNSKGHWADAARKPTPAEIALAASSPGGQFWIGRDGPYCADAARRLSDSRVRVLVLAPEPARGAQHG